MPSGVLVSTDAKIQLIKGNSLCIFVLIFPYALGRFGICFPLVSQSGVQRCFGYRFVTFSFIYFGTSHSLSLVISFSPEHYNRYKSEYYNRWMESEFFPESWTSPISSNNLPSQFYQDVNWEFDQKDSGHPFIDSLCYLNIWSFEGNVCIRKYSKDLRETSFYSQTWKSKY